MASTSGYFTWTSSNQYVDAHISWSLVSQNVAENYSTINWNLSFSRTNTGYTTSRYWYGSINVAGNTYSHANGDESNYVDIVYGSNTIVMSGTTNIWHNADGTQSFYIGTLGTSYLRKKTASADITVGEYQQSYTLPTIARASSVSATNANVGSNSTITITRASSSFTHTLTYKIGSATGTIADKTASTSIAWKIPASVTTQMANAKSGTVTITCDTYSGSTKVGTSTCTFTATIPASTITSAPATNLGSAMAIAISRINTSDSNLTHTLTYKFVNASGTLLTKSTSASTSWTVPTSLGSQISSATQGDVTLTLTTYHGTATVGSTTKTATLKVPSYTPTIGTLSTSITGDTVSQGWGIYVQGKSKCALSLGTCSTSYGATISSYNISGEGINVNASSGTTSVLSKAGTFTYTAKVTDSRGKTNTTTKSITVIAYSIPTFSKVLSQRHNGTALADDGTSVQSSITFTYSNIGNNSVTTAIAYKTGSDSYTSAGASFVSGTAVVWGSGNINADSSYTVRYSITDAYTTTYYYDTISTAKFIIDIMDEGKGIAFGKSAELEDAVEIAPNWAMAIGDVNKLMIGGMSSKHRYYPISEAAYTFTSLADFWAHAESLMGNANIACGRAKLNFTANGITVNAWFRWFASEQNKSGNGSYDNSGVVFLITHDGDVRKFNVTGGQASVNNVGWAQHWTVNGTTFSGTATNASYSSMANVVQVGSDHNIIPNRFGVRTYTGTPDVTNKYCIFAQADFTNNCVNIGLDGKGAIGVNSAKTATTASQVKTSGNGMINNATSNSTNICGGTDLNTGACLVLRGKDQTSAGAGYFQLYAKNGTYTAMLQGTPDGTLSWTGERISGAGIELSFSTPYIDFHFNKSTSDYTARIIENSSGALKVYNSISNASDERLKKNIVELDNKLLGLFEKVEPRQYRFKKGDDYLKLGFIAQEVDDALDELGIDDKPLIQIPEKKDDYYGLDYNDLIALLWKKVQLMDSEIKELKSELLQLKETQVNC